MQIGKRDACGIPFEEVEGGIGDDQDTGGGEGVEQGRAWGVELLESGGLRGQGGSSEVRGGGGVVAADANALGDKVGDGGARGREVLLGV